MIAVKRSASNDVAASAMVGAGGGGAGESWHASGPLASATAMQKEAQARIPTAVAASKKRLSMSAPLVMPPQLPKDAIVLINLSGRGDKDVNEVRLLLEKQGR